VDTFRFVDLHRTLELNPGEADRLRQKLQQALTSPESLERLRAPAQKWFARRTGPPVETRIAFTRVAGGKQTLLEIVARDRPGLLFDISRVLAEHACDIAVALIDTEATKAIDVFYISANSSALPDKLQAQVAEGLKQSLG
jgi:[protein-PII] uridylyltransferase